MRVTAYRAYYADPLRVRLADGKVEFVIPPRKNRRKPAHCSHRLYRRRRKVENWTANCRTSGASRPATTNSPPVISLSLIWPA